MTRPGVTDEARAAQGVRSALARYRVMAYVVGIGLIVLVFVGVPLQYGAGVPQVAQIVGPIHGAMYIVYLAIAVDLARRGPADDTSARNDRARGVRALRRVRRRAQGHETGRGEPRNSGGAGLTLAPDRFLNCRQAAKPMATA